MKEKNKEIIGVIIAGSIILIVLYVISFLFGGGLLSLLGFKYDSLYTLIKFFTIYFIIDLPLGFLIDGISKVFMELKGLSKLRHDIINFCMTVSSDVVVLSILSASVKGIFMKPTTIIAFPIVTYFINYFLDKKLDEGLNGDKDIEDELN